MTATCMVNEEPKPGRRLSLRNRMRYSSSGDPCELSHLPRRYWLLICVLCVTSSCLVQYLAPILQNVARSYLICVNPLLQESTKTALGCRVFVEDRRRFLRISPPPERITYFEEPVPIEPWSRDVDNAESFDLLVSPRLQIQQSPNKDPWTEAETLAALKAAKRSREVGNVRKAEVIIEHAYALAPQHPDVLTEYGIFIETVRNNIVEAEGLYKKALHLDPTHSEALTRRAKTQPLVEEIDNNMLRKIRQMQEQFLNIPRWNPGLKRAMRESYFQHIYHTVALEGNTFTLGQTRSILETKIAVAGKSIIEHNEILGMDAALRFLNQSLTQVGNLHLEDILAIHRRVLGFVDPLAAGVIRNTQVYVGSFTPPSPELVHSELMELIEWLNDEETLRIDPVELAALAHYKLVYIHPFIDGNGRTARLLMNFILMQAGFPPVIIPVEERSQYYATLKSANDGDLRPFIRLIGRLTNDCLQSFISSAICEAGDCVKSSSRVIETE